MKALLRPVYRALVAFGWWIVRTVPALRPIHETQGTQTPITFRTWFLQKVLGFNRHVYWPCHFTSTVTGGNNVYCGIETCPGYSPGCYIQAIGKIHIGDYTQIAPNVGIITANHDLHDNRSHPEPSTVRIGKYCWIGMNVMILPGVELGDYTIVGAGAVVTKPFPEGYCVIGGNPARILRQLDRAKCVFHRSPVEYNGYIPSARFEAFRQQRLNV